MDGPLTQRDIDSLIQGRGASAEGSPAEIVAINFARPPRLSKERHTALENVFTQWALSLRALLTARLRVRADVVLHSVEQATFAEFALSLGAPCAAFTFALGERVPGQGVLDLGTDLAFASLERLFGGAGSGAAPARALSALEQNAVRGLAERMLGVLGQAWEEHVPMAPAVLGFEASPDALRGLEREEGVVVATLDVEFGDSRGTLTLGLPVAVLEPFLQQRAPARATEIPAGGSSATQRAQLERMLREARVTLTARLPRVWLSARVVAGLAEGQVLGTGFALDTPVDVYLNGRLRYCASLGQLRRRIGLRITHTVTAPGAERPGPVREGRVS
jgi:flagellar motor switch protein FliM